MSKEFSISEIQKELKRVNPFGDVISKSDFSKITEWVNTGNYHLNAVFSGDLFGGIPNNRTICLAGDSGTGKTFLLLNMCREAQKMGYYVIYYDTEGAVDVDNIQNFGVDPERFDHQPMSDIAKFRTSITTLVKKLMEAKEKGFKTPKIFVALDSLGMLATQKEIDDAISGNTAADMTRAKSIRSLFRIITSDLTGLGIPFVFTNHTYASTGMFPTVNLSGGGGLIYSASVILALSKAQIKEGTVQTGIIVTVKTLKNRFGKPIPIKFHIRWDRGMNPYIGMEEYMNWENCGIQKGNLFNQKDFDKFKESDKLICKSFEFNGETLYFYPKETARNYIVRHLGRGVTAQELFTEQVWTVDVLKEINEKCIKPKFSYGTISENDSEIEAFLNDEVDAE
jgi:RecA/RadA recombinase